jgi:putative nucleotidyltransferase with HDIG domain
MRWLAPRFNADVELWGIAGLLHDLDFEATREKPEMHGVVTSEMLAQFDLPQEITDAIQRHNAEALHLERESVADYALTCAETITGLIVAAALVHPDRKIRQLNVKSVVKRMKSKDFARNVNREHIVLCERIGIPLAEFIQLSIDAMNSISEELGL